MPTKSGAPIIAGNWKMYKTLPEATQFINEIKTSVDETKAEVWLAVPFTLIRDLCAEVKETKIKIGAQNMNDASEGAFTGEVSARMLIDAGADFVVLGHSERRLHFKETDEMIDRKVKRALKDGLKVLLCIGESLDEHENGQIKETLETQILGSLASVEESQFENIFIAYEPIWAIGSGKSAVASEVAEENNVIRAIVSSKWGKNVGDNIKILYGGSVNSENAESFLTEENINGLFIGSASLNSQSFAKIIALT